MVYIRFKLSWWYLMSSFHQFHGSILALRGIRSSQADSYERCARSLWRSNNPVEGTTTWCCLLRETAFRSHVMDVMDVMDDSDHEVGLKHIDLESHGDLGIILRTPRLVRIEDWNGHKIDHKSFVTNGPFQKIRKASKEWDCGIFSYIFCLVMSSPGLLMFPV